MTRRRRAGLGLLVVLAAATMASLVAPGSAGAGAQTRRATAANWYWRAQQLSPVDGSPVLRDPKDGDRGTTLVVAGPTAAGEADRFAVLRLDVGDLRITEVRRALLVVPVTEASGVPTGTPADRDLDRAGALPVLVACATRGQWADGPGGRPASEAPAVDCATSARALPGPDGAYRLDIAAFVGALVDGSASGVALVPDPAQPSPYELRLGPRPEIGLDVLTEAVDDGPPPTTVPPPFPSSTGAVDPGGLVAPSPTLGPAPPPAAVAMPGPSAPVPAGFTGFGSTTPARAPLAVLVLFAAIGALALLFLSPSLT